MYSRLQNYPGKSSKHTTKAQSSQRIKALEFIKHSPNGCSIFISNPMIFLCGVLIFSRPVSANVRWSEVEGLLLDLGARIEEREGSRVLIRLFGERRVFHRPHPSPITDKGAVASLRDWLNDNGVKP